MVYKLQIKSVIVLVSNPFSFSFFLHQKDMFLILNGSCSFKLIVPDEAFNFACRSVCQTPASKLLIASLMHSFFHLPSPSFSTAMNDKVWWCSTKGKRLYLLLMQSYYLLQPFRIFFPPHKKKNISLRIKCKRKRTLINSGTLVNPPPAIGEDQII